MVKLNEDLKIWNKNASLYDKYLKQDQDIYQKLINEPSIFKLLGNLKGKKVLDAGCGTGVFSHRLKLKRAKAMGVDGAPNLIKLAEKNYPEIKFEIADLTKKLPFENSSFDMVVCKMVLPHLPTVEKTFTEFYRILNRKGILLISLPHPVLTFYFYLKNKWQEKKEFSWTGMEGYFKKVKIKASMGKDETFFPLIGWYRPLKFYLNKITAAGFLLEKIDEPELTREFKKKFPDYYKRKKEIPLTLNLKFLKL